MVNRFLREFIEIDSFLFDFGNENLLRLLTFIPCRFPLIPVPPTGFTGWRGPILQEGSARNLQEFANWAEFEREWAEPHSHDNLMEPGVPEAPA